MEIGISELQKNVSLFRHLREPLKVVDKKSRETLALVLPKRENGPSIVDALGGVFKEAAMKAKEVDLDEAVARAYAEEMEARHGRRSVD